MQLWHILVLLLVLTATAFAVGFRRSVRVAQRVGGVKGLHSRPLYHGLFWATCCALPGLLVFAVWASLEGRFIDHYVLSRLPAELLELSDQRRGLILNGIKSLAAGINSSADNPEQHAAMLDSAELYAAMGHESRIRMAMWVVLAALAGTVTGFFTTRPAFRARVHFERVVVSILICSSTLAIFTTIGIVLSVLFESIRFFQHVPITDFLFGLEWSPQTAIRAEQVGSSGAFGIVPLFVGTLLISAIAMIVGAPIGLLSAVYLAEYASRRVRAVAKPLLEILAGIPTVVYGFFAALTVAPFLRDTGAAFGVSISSESALAAGFVMGLMLIPNVSSLSDDFISSVPQSLRDGSFALGATQSETITKVILPAALPGIVGGLLLAVSRAIGETMIVVMAAGLTAKLTLNPLEAVTTVTVQIVTLLVGDQEFDSPKTLAAFALGLVLFFVTLALNFIALHVVRKYREQYD